MRVRIAAALALAAIGFSGAAHAQSAVEGRVDRLEAEMRAVQRKVFPGGAGAQVVQPQYTSPQGPSTAPGLPSGTLANDISARLSALESQQTALTAQVEQLQHRQRQLEDAFGNMKLSFEARLKTLEDLSMRVGAQPAGEIPAPVETRPSSSRPAPAKPEPKPAADAAPKPGTKADPQRGAKLAAIEAPSTGNPAADGYTYGYRLWQAKLYPEAIAALKDVTTKYPKDPVWSRAQNLLGRAYLDSGAPSTAAKVFYDNYQKLPSGDRAPESLYYLAQALTQRNASSADVCRVYSELTDVYGSKLSAEMKAGVAEGRAKQKCM